jgi:hypothetical protein
MKWTPLKNGSTLELADQPAGDYQVARRRQVEFGQVGESRMHTVFYLDRRRFKLAAGATESIAFARPGARRLSGSVKNLEETGVEKAIVLVCSESALDDESLPNLDVTIFDARGCNDDGAFQTEPLAPGKYVLVVQGYPAIPPDALNRTGIIQPQRVEKLPFEVLEEGDLPRLDISVKKVKTKHGM